MQINPAFPPSRLDMPKRRAERQIYQSLADSAVPGRALYEVKVTPAATQVDFLVWAEGVAAYSVQVKGGRYLVHEGEFCLVTDWGRTPQPGLPAQVWDSAMAVPDHLQRRLGHRLFIIPVLALPDMEQDKDIQDLAARRSVMTLFGLTGWVNRLVDLASTQVIRHRPTGASIEAEVAAIMPELAPAPTPTAPQVVIQNVEHLHIHVGPEAIEGLSHLMANSWILEGSAIGAQTQERHPQGADRPV